MDWVVDTGWKDSETGVIGVGIPENPEDPSDSRSGSKSVTGRSTGNRDDEEWLGRIRKFRENRFREQVSEEVTPKRTEKEVRNEFH